MATPKKYKDERLWKVVFKDASKLIKSVHLTFKNNHWCVLSLCDDDKSKYIRKTFATYEDAHRFAYRLAADRQVRVVHHE